MRKMIGVTLAGAMLFGLSAGMVGCSDETGSKVEEKVTTPGGTTKVTNELKVQKSGENPPLAPTDTTKP
jgi:pyrroline-5-carboxylate reductase